MSMSLELNEQHDLEKAAYVQACRGRIETDVTADWTGVKRARDVIRVLVQQPAPPQLVEERLSLHGTKIDLRDRN